MSVRLWNAATLEPRASIGGAPMAGVRKLTFSPRGQIAGQRRHGRHGLPWDPIAGRCGTLFGGRSHHGGPVTGVAFLPGCGGMVSGGRGPARSASGRPTCRASSPWRLHACPRTRGVHGATVSPTASGWPPAARTASIALRDPSSGGAQDAQGPQRHRLSGGILARPPAAGATAGSDGTVRLWSLARGEEIIKYNGYGPAFAGVASTRPSRPTANGRSAAAAMARSRCSTSMAAKSARRSPVRP